MFDTKFVVVVRDDLAVWQKLNVAAFLSSGIASAVPEIIGEPYRDADGNMYTSLAVQPVIILATNADNMKRIHRRVVDRNVTASVYIEEMFAAPGEPYNRMEFAKYTPDDAKVVGIVLHAEKKIADKVTKGAKLHG